jgi:iron complex outermembrane receptor protein
MNRTVRFAVRASMLAVAGAAVSLPLYAAETEELDEVVVTGSSIKGVAPVGSNLVTVGREEIEETGVQTVQQILKTVPSIVGLQSAGQGSYGSFDGAGTNAPTIHGLGASASNSTLVLLNGHRLPVSGINHVLADPNIVAPLALERVEVLADGASSVYGSDAVAGVVNFITRRNVDGFEATAQKGFGDNYGTFNAGAIGGKTWDSGSFLMSYNYSDRDNLAAADRDFAKANQTARGGRNFQTTINRCSPASIGLSAAQYNALFVPASAVTAAQTIYSGYTSTSTAAAGDCDPSQYWDLIPSEKRHSFFASLRQDVGDKITLTTDLIYSNRKNLQHVTRGSASGTVYGTGATLPTGRSVNPFFRVLTGATTGTAPTSYTVNFNADQLLGPGATIAGTAETFYGRFDADIALSDAWSVNAGALIGLDEATQVNTGQLNAAVFNLALNGFTAATLNGVAQSATQALNPGNAIDVFGANTSAAARALLTDNRQLQMGDQRITNVYARVSGDLFEMGGGSAKVALGGEYLDYSLDQDIVRGNNLGAGSVGSTFQHIPYQRDVKSAYAEVFLPILKDQGVRSLDVILAGRVDDYSDVGSTKNPKLAVNLEVIDGLKFRGNWSKSFVAPALTSRGSNAAGLTGESGFNGITGGQLPGGAPTISYASFPGAASIPGCPAAPATSCSLGAITGMLLTGGNGNLKPQRGKAFSFGVDFAPLSIPGLSTSLTYWSNKLRGGITAPQPALALGSADLSYLLQLFPAGATATQIGTATAGLPQTGPLNTNTYFIYNFQQNNVLNLNVTGLDAAASYRFDTDLGKFTVSASVSRKLKFDQFFGANGTVFSVLHTAGFNTTFPSVKAESRLNLGYSRGPFSASMFYNYLSGYKNWGGTVARPVVRTNGVPTSGGDPVKSFSTIDLNLSYRLTDFAGLSVAQVFVDATNLTDKAPPQYNAFNTNGSAGYDNINASPIGRVITLGVRAKF